jgi:mannose-1-phosphate guanylyltransferase
MYAVIPAGGSGTRLWPLSRSDRPKFLLDLGDVGSGGQTTTPTLIQQTRARLDGLAKPETTLIVTGSAHAAEVARQLPELPAGNIIVEPAPRDSAPAIGLAATLIHRRDQDAVMGSFAADHLVTDVAAFHTAVRLAAETARHGLLLTLGLTPTGPETGFGYLRRGESLGGGAYRVEEFTEKPPVDVARRYVADGRYLWNASMFVWQTETFLAELRRQVPELYDGLQRIADDWDTPRRDETLGAIWPTLPKRPVDTAVMEGAGARGLVATVPADLGWTDVGDWDTLADVLPAGSDGVVRLGPGTVLAHDTAGTLVYGGTDRIVATLGVTDLVVVDTPDAVLVCHRDRAQDVKALVDELKAAGRTDLT